MKRKLEHAAREGIAIHNGKRLSFRAAALLELQSPSWKGAYDKLIPLEKEPVSEERARRWHDGLMKIYDLDMQIQRARNDAYYAEKRLFTSRQPEKFLPWLQALPAGEQEKISRMRGEKTIVIHDEKGEKYWVRKELDWPGRKNSPFKLIVYGEVKTEERREAFQRMRVLIEEIKKIEV